MSIKPTNKANFCKKKLQRRVKTDKIAHILKRFVCEGLLILQKIKGGTVKQSEKDQKKYNPNVGFIGNAEVQVSNYIFSTKRLRTAYKHAQPIADRLMKKDISGHYTESRKVTKFLKNRDLTFSKKTASGEYKTFVVPCTTTVVPMQKSIFNEVEVAAQKLVISLRRVIQDIYSSKDIQSSEFVKSLPTSVRDIFVHAIETSPNYFPQFHHKNMKDYPFFDNVGLDLVLVEDYLSKSAQLPELVANKKIEDLPGLPFRILELNAGSPSGASNNMNVLEGIYDQAPEILENLGKLMPNDHFEILGETYKSLGEYWTNKTDAVQILLPPGGQNGAAPEIHQLAAYSGLIYADADQLYCDEKGYIRLRTVSKNNPIVNAIYSRINADSALFDPKKDLVMKDPDSGEPLYLRDGLILDSEEEGKLVKDENGNPIPLESSYAIPGIIDAIINRKIYMGGLNRILDNKIILATLTHYAPKFFAADIEKAGLSLSVGHQIQPPQTLPPTIKSVEAIEKNPDEWVVKAPELAGGQGVYILKTLSKAEKQKVLKMIRQNPQDFAYQQLVKIARIPVAVQRKAEGFKFANLAADIRTWVFFGAGEGALPRMSHNALVRYAPQEKGKMSSIVNTSAGGGYAPFVIVDDTNDKSAVSAKELTKSKRPVVLHTEAPVFVAAQIIQIARMLKEANRLLSAEVTLAFELLILARGMRNQLKEILSFLHPRSIEGIYQVIDLLESKMSKSEVKNYQVFISENQIELTQALFKLSKDFSLKPVRDILDNIQALNLDIVTLKYTSKERELDLIQITKLEALAKTTKSKKHQKAILEIAKTIAKTVNKELPNRVLTKASKRKVLAHLETFCAKAKSRLEASPALNELANLLSLDADVTQLQFETLYLGERDIDMDIKVATQSEMRTGKLLIQSDFVSDELKAAKADWEKTLNKSYKVDLLKREDFIKTARKKHFKKHPKLARYQELIDSKSSSKQDLIELLDIAPYAKFNIQNFAMEQGISVEDVFTTSLEPNRISLLSTKELKELKLANREHAGECFAKKKVSHGLFSNSDVFVWLRSELDPFTLLYTAGHELIHYQQIMRTMRAEKNALAGGDISLAKFLNYYGNFLGANQRTVESMNSDMASTRKPLYGYVDLLINHKDSEIVKVLDEAIRSGDAAWEEKLSEFGSLFSYVMANNTGTRVKALQEVLPALENAKNILFAQELGLEVSMNAVQAAMPTANESQVAEYMTELIATAYSPNPNWEGMRIIASHQYYGVSFNRAEKPENNLKLVPQVTAVSVGNSYNQTQQ